VGSQALCLRWRPWTRRSAPGRPRAARRKLIISEQRPPGAVGPRSAGHVPPGQPVLRVDLRQVLVASGVLR
jgi:hypothetical protein